jgi:hypothetical protein
LLTAVKKIVCGKVILIAIYRFNVFKSAAYLAEENMDRVLILAVFFTVKK